MSHTTKLDHTNNFNNFLLDLAESLILSLKNDPDALDALQGNKLFMSNRVASDGRGFSKKENTIFSLTQELLQDLSILDDYLDMQMKTEEEYSEEKEDTIADFIDEIMPLVAACTIIDENQKNTDFEEEYEATYQRVMKKIMPIHTAEEALLDWKDAISESYLQSTLISMKFGYIEQKVS